MPTSAGLYLERGATTKRSRKSRKTLWKSIRTFFWRITSSAMPTSSKDRLPKQSLNIKKRSTLEPTIHTHLAALGQARARTGQKDEAHKILGRLNEEGKSRYVAALRLALVLYGLGEQERGASMHWSRPIEEGTGHTSIIHQSGSVSR